MIDKDISAGTNATRAFPEGISIDSAHDRIFLPPVASVMHWVLGFDHANCAWYKNSSQNKSRFVCTDHDMVAPEAVCTDAVESQYNKNAGRQLIKSKLALHDLPYNHPPKPKPHILPWTVHIDNWRYHRHSECAQVLIDKPMHILPWTVHIDNWSDQITSLSTKVVA